MLSIQCLDSRLTYDNEVVSLTRRLSSSPQKHFFRLLVLVSVRLSKPQGIVKLEGLGELKKLIHLIGSRKHDLPGCNINVNMTSRRRSAPQSVSRNVTLTLTFSESVAPKRIVTEVHK
jgi:hypothetical protein